MSNTYRRAVLEYGNGQTLALSTRERQGAARHVLTGVPGWWGGVGVKGDNTERQGHGVFPEDSTRTGRELTLQGTLRYDDTVDRDTADRFVSAILGDGTFGKLTVLSGDYELAATVKLAGEIGHKWVGQHAMDIQVPLLAPDPHLYAEERAYQLFPAGFGEGLDYPLFADDVLDFMDGAAGSMLPLHNAGTAKAWPRFVVRGNWPSGFRLTSEQQTVEYGAPVFSQSPAVVDMRTGSVQVGGADMTHAVTRRGWFGADPHSTIQPRITAVGQAQGWADVTIADTYI